MMRHRESERTTQIYVHRIPDIYNFFLQLFNRIDRLFLLLIINHAPQIFCRIEVRRRGWPFDHNGEPLDNRSSQRRPRIFTSTNVRFFRHLSNRQRLAGSRDLVQLESVSLNGEVSAQAARRRLCLMDELSMVQKWIVRSYSLGPTYSTMHHTQLIYRTE